MVTNETQIRVRYAETDQMGYVYYGRFMEYFEVGRAELLRQIGLSYADLENVHDVMCPVAAVDVQYKRPVRYDMLITIKTEVKELPDKRIIFYATTLLPDGQIANTASVNLAFIDSNSYKPIRAPKTVVNFFQKAFQVSAQ